MRISHEQMAALDAFCFGEFVRRAGDFLAVEGHPERWADAPDEELDAWVAERVRRAEAAGLSEHDCLLRFLQVASHWGDDFALSHDVLFLLTDLRSIADWPHAERSIRDRIHSFHAEEGSQA